MNRRDILRYIADLFPSSTKLSWGAAGRAALRTRDARIGEAAGDTTSGQMRAVADLFPRRLGMGQGTGTCKGE
uniref:Uncharacterized protein n=1 Tax=uncultured bacterium CBNPD1 BAC clone 67 TaxID=417306 RepID=B1N6G2_9BACT|nr:hypothetical protein [uncultured bacterium CBNPD1 BAC clone 67]